MEGSGSHGAALPPDTVVVRGGVMTAEKVMAAAEANYRDEGLYSLSVWATPGATAEEIARAAVDLSEDHLPHNQMQTSTVGRLAECRFELVPTPPDGHYSLVLPAPPSDADVQTIMEAFDEPRQNPVARSRR